MGLTTLARIYYNYYYGKVQHALDNAEDQQHRLLLRLIKEAEDTEWGNLHHYSEITSYSRFAKTVPVNTYEELKTYIDRMRHGEKDILWKGKVNWFAKSSGTTNDKSKFIPVSKNYLKDTHFGGGLTTVAYYLHNYPKSRFLDGRALLLGGSHQPNYDIPQSVVGDLSAIMMENVPAWVQRIREPKKRIALLSDFEQKRDLIAQTTLSKNITNLSGVPSWMLSVLNRVLEVSGKKYITDVWPNLEVFFHGGVAFAPYRDAYKEIIPSDSMHYMETYNASEGFFGLQTNPNDPAMELMTHLGVFFEFLPLENMNSNTIDPIPLWEVETDRNYALVISTSTGLWRYEIGDTIRFVSTKPYKFVITGRTKSFINAFGEELIVDNAEQGLKEACQLTGAEISEYTAAPIFMDKNAKCRHQWLIEFSQMPDSIEHFAEVLDESLQKINSDYEAKRAKNITLQPLEIIVAKPGLFNTWLKSEGKLGGQHKVPRLCNDRRIIEKVLAFNN